MRVIVLGAEPFKNSMLNISDLESPLLIPFCGKSLYCYFLSHFHSCRLTFVINERSNFTKQLISFSSTGRDVEIIEISVDGVARLGPADSLRKALTKIEIDDEEVLVMYADNIISFEEVKTRIEELREIACDGILFTTDFRESNRYSSFRVSREKEISEFIGKNKNHGDISSLKTDIGVYYLKSITLLSRLLNQSSKPQIPECLVGSAKFINADLEDWQDLGHWDLLSNPRHIGQSREFNSLSFGDDGYLIKSSHNHEKIHSEIRFYKEIPQEFEMDFPRMRSLKNRSDAYLIEYWPLKSLSEYIVFWGLINSKVREFLSMINSRLLLYRNFSELNQFIEVQSLAEFHEDKLKRGLGYGNKELKEILDFNNLYVNGVELEGFAKLSSSIKKQIREKSAGSEPGFLHGDLCFSNILISPQENLIKFIDPRGSFLDFVNFGDLRYDLAKLFQGLGGFYDFIKGGRYYLKRESTNSWTLRLFITSTFLRQIEEYQSILLNGFSDITSSELYFWVAINYISFLPLHEDAPQDQVVFILMALLLLNFNRADLVVTEV